MYYYIARYYSAKRMISFISSLSEISNRDRGRVRGLGGGVGDDVEVLQTPVSDNFPVLHFDRETNNARFLPSLGSSGSLECTL
jgi:hypothetical protein